MTAAEIATLAFKKVLDTSAGELTKQFTQTAIAKMDELCKAIWQKLRGNPNAEKTLQEIEGGSESNLKQLVECLEEAMKNDSEFASQLQTLAQQINAGKLQDNSSTTQINRDNAKGWQTKVEGGTAYIGEIHIHDKPSNP